MSKEEIVVYWGPCYDVGPDNVIDWNMFYADPTELLPDLKKMKDKTAGNQSILYCPAFTENYKNTFVFSSVVDSRFSYNHRENLWEIPNKYQIHPATTMRTSYMENRKPLVLSMIWLFVSEEPLEMEIISPYLHQTESSKYGVIATGRFDIGRWYRPIHADYLLWSGLDNFAIKEGDPFFYVRFNTDKKVVLKRYINTPEIYKQTVSNVETKFLFGKTPPLAKLYNYFSKTRTRDIMLKKIKEAVIE
jgi:hypothetical protein